MSHRKDRERAESGLVYRNGQIVSKPSKIKAKGVDDYIQQIQALGKIVKVERREHKEVKHVGTSSGQS